MSKKLPINGPFNGLPFYENGAKSRPCKQLNRGVPVPLNFRFPFCLLFPVYHPIAYTLFSHIDEPAWTVDSTRDWADSGETAITKVTCDLKTRKNNLQIDNHSPAMVHRRDPYAWLNIFTA